VLKFQKTKDEQITQNFPERKMLFLAKGPNSDDIRLLCANTGCRETMAVSPQLWRGGFGCPRNLCSAQTVFSYQHRMKTFLDMQRLREFAFQRYSGDYLTVSSSSMCNKCKASTCLQHNSNNTAMCKVGSEISSLPTPPR
jgi:hypothetical protein